MHGKAEEPVKQEPKEGHHGPQKKPLQKKAFHLGAAGAVLVLVHDAVLSLGLMVKTGQFTIAETVIYGNRPLTATPSSAPNWQPQDGGRDIFRRARARASWQAHSPRPHIGTDGVWSGEALISACGVWIATPGCMAWDGKSGNKVFLGLKIPRKLSLN